MEYSLIIFDLDGTLVDAYRAITESFNYTMRAMGYAPQSPLCIRRKVGWGDENLLRPFVKGADLKKALSLYRRHHARALVRFVRFLPGAKTVLRYVARKGLRIAIASNRPTRFSRIIIRTLGMDHFIDDMLCADTLRHGKPHPAILRVLMRRNKVSPRQTLFVGDMAIDAQTGRRAKVKTVLVCTGSSSPQEIKREKPYKILPSIVSLTEIL